MKMSPARRRLAPALAFAAVLLAACGGGGGGGSSAPLGPPPSVRFGASSSLENICTLDGQKRFVRAYMDEVYLWYNEIPELDASQYANISDYFNALLVKTPDANGVPKDRFSAVLPESAVRASIAQSAAAPVAADLGTALAATFSVPVSKVVTTPGGRRVGYIQFNDHASGAQDELISDFRALRDAGIQDIALDLRFNSGGFLYVAQSTASMITGPANNGRVFEQLMYNDKRGAETAASALPFIGAVTFAETRYPAGTELPQLGLTRAYILTSGNTCSASESIINSLRGIDVEVILVGSKTCGKPYGFHQKNNCGMAFFPIEFRGSNAKGFGDYTVGFSPTCAVTDNPAAFAGSGTDPLLNAALYHSDHGACPPVASSALAGSSLIPGITREVPARPAWLGRVLTGAER
ncbi:S41 family peptidase [Ramlibacter sp. XY19]|uniref:S41 family peptidase n=1 Tax=Ramlibacter paludis TaxID=2908000 RepID=UPI0023DA4141|nr:S41 family peptidase [Ramlibacter paludis]MCG2591418.1 S41 family peptidase [Ramlibacter paludis]